MHKYMRNMKFMAVASALLVFLVGAPVVYGGLSWTGIDPKVTLAEGQVIHVEALIPDGVSECAIDSIEMVIRAPKGASVEESVFCDGERETRSKLARGHDDKLKVIAGLRSDERMPAGVRITVPGRDPIVCLGKTNKRIKCSADLEDDDHGHDD